MQYQYNFCGYCALAKNGITLMRFGLTSEVVLIFAIG
jgi:hypothetical protein